MLKTCGRVVTITPRVPKKSSVSVTLSHLPSFNGELQCRYRPFDAVTTRHAKIDVTASERTFRSTGAAYPSTSVSRPLDDRQKAPQICHELAASKIPAAAWLFDGFPPAKPSLKTHGGQGRQHALRQVQQRHRRRIAAAGNAVIVWREKKLTGIVRLVWKRRQRLEGFGFGCGQARKGEVFSGLLKQCHE